jgi:protein arginine kinase activator
MMCQRCGKEVATIHLTEISNNQKQERHLCEECAREEGIAIAAQTVNLKDVLSGFLQAHETASAEAGLACPLCGITYAEFRNQGRLGCPNDYDVFAEPLAEVFQKVHGGAEHTGKVPVRSGGAGEEHRELIQLRRRLQEAVDGEDYEQAAELRDQIREKEAAGDA